jgi:signal transduction histidine kinase
VGHEAREAVLIVADEGAGIPEDALPHVFERFYRAESSRAGEGTGLGLAIVRETVEALEGRNRGPEHPWRGLRVHRSPPVSEKLPERERLSEKS